MKTNYRGVEITLNEMSGKFRAVVNGVCKDFASLKSAQNFIDKNAVVEFVPVEVLVVKEKGYSPSTYTVKKVKLVGYYEQKGYRGHLSRYFRVEGGDSIRISDSLRARNFEVYPLTALEKLTALCKERTEQSLIASKADKRVDKLGDQIDALSIDLDPRPEMKSY